MIIKPKNAKDYFIYTDEDPDDEGIQLLLFRVYMAIWNTDTDHQFIREMFIEDWHIEKAMDQAQQICFINYEENFTYWIIAIEQTGDIVSRLK